MASYPVIVIKPERDWPLRNHHHAIYKTAIGRMPFDSAQSRPDVKNGSIAEVRSDMGDFLCYAMINIHAYICGRAISFEEKEDPMVVLRRNIERSIALRRSLISTEDSNAIRLINAEGDGIPGLIVDRVVHEPYGAHPSYVQGYYDRDNESYLAWDILSQDHGAVLGWLDEWVYGLENHAAYRRKLGQAYFDKLKPEPLLAPSVDYGRYR